MVYFMVPNPIKIHDLGVPPIFGNTHIQQVHCAILNESVEISRVLIYTLLKYPSHVRQNPRKSDEIMLKR